MRSVRRASITLATVLVAGCTFGDLAGYDIPLCNPNLPTQKSDECDHLNAGDTSTCSPYRCDAEQHCTRGVRDDDRDGDPSTTCGGTDCDDSDPNNRAGTRAAEVCDGRDNNCNGVVDEGLVYVSTAGMPVTTEGMGTGLDPFLIGDSGTHMVGGYVATSADNGHCIQVLNLTDDNGPPGAIQENASCAFLSEETHLGPAQPVAQVFSVNGTANGSGTAFVATSKNDTCGNVESLEYRGPTSTSNNFSSSLDCATRNLGVSLPSLSQLPNGSALLLWFETPYATRTDPVDGCAKAAPAPLVASLLPNPSDVPAAIPKPFVVASASTSVRRAATATVPTMTDAVLVAAPSGQDVAVWVLDQQGVVTAATESIPSLADARGVSLSVGAASGTTVQLALTAEIGCYAASVTGQAIAVSFGTFDTSTRQATFAAAVTVSPASSALSTTPSAVWLSGVPLANPRSGLDPFMKTAVNRTEWMVTWTNSSDASGAVLFAHRFGGDGSDLSPSFPFAPSVQLGAPAAAGNGKVFTVDTSGRGFASVQTDCPAQ